MSALIERLQNEVALCRNDGADDIANLLELAATDFAMMETRDTLQIVLIGKLRNVIDSLRAENERLRGEIKKGRKILVLYEEEFGKLYTCCPSCFRHIIKAFNNHHEDCLSMKWLKENE